MAEIYVYSTLTDSVVYDTDSGRVEIAGGANSPDKHFFTPQGVVTKITDEQLAALKQNRVFDLHHKNGFLSWSSKKEDVEKVVSGMQGADAAAPDTEADAAVEEKKSGTKTRAKKDA